MDWNKIRADYLAGGGSYRELAAKYGVSYVTIARRAKSENWRGWRAESDNMVITKTVEAITNANVNVNTSLQDAALALIGKAVEGINGIDPRNASALKAYSGVLKDLRAVLDIRSDLDLEEQRARIDKLRRDSEPDKPEDLEDDGLLEALGTNAKALFADGDDCGILPEEQGE